MRVEEGKIAATSKFVSKTGEHGSLLKASYEESIGWYQRYSRLKLALAGHSGDLRKLCVGQQLFGPTPNPMCCAKLVPAPRLVETPVEKPVEKRVEKRVEKPAGQSIPVPVH